MGNWWRGLSADGRVGFVIGYTHGLCEGGAQVLNALSPLSEKQEKSIPRCTFPAETTFGQIMDAVNQFYEDANNRLILIQDAFTVVRAQIEGHPLSPQQILDFRRVAAQISDK